MSERRANRRFVTSDGIAPVDAHQRPRDYLTPDEMRRLLIAARSERHGPRDQPL